ncbi:MAG: response regulator transcription factor [Caulobacteraceae bacterium]|nr:response regulator transcription factor [Caulobacter sp.]
MAQSKTVLVVDDDDDLRTALAEQLELEGFRTDQAPTGEAGVAAAIAGRPDLVLLDLDLPGIDGRETCRRLREADVAAPVIMLTASAGDADTIAGLDAGADDYVAKPFRFAVLLARIRAQLRAHEQSEHAVFHIGPYEFRPAQKLLTDGRRKVRLTEKETSILKYLYRAGGQPVGREELLAEVWGYNAGVTTHTLETHIYRLRQKVQPAEAGAAPILVTDAGGYRLQA